MENDLKLVPVSKLDKPKKKKKMLFIVNANSGKGQIKNKILEIIDIFTKAGYLVTVHTTQDRLDAQEMAKNNAKKYSLIVCSGGDGTINEVVDGIMECEVRPTIGYIPAGTVNDFAQGLKISRDMIKAANDIVERNAFACDVGQFNEDFFTYIAGFGLFTDVAYVTPQQSKNILGRQAYILEGAKRLGSIPIYHMKVWHDDTFIEDDFIFGVVTNAITVGGFKGFRGKHVKLDDGLFEVSLIKDPKNAVEMQAIITSLIKKELDPNMIVSFRTANLKIECDQKVAWTLDGEFGGEEKLVEIKAHKKAIKIIRGKGSST